MAKKDDPNKDKIERIDPETGEVTYSEPTEATEGGFAADVASIPEAETVDEAGQPVEPTEVYAEPERIHAYDAGEFNPELKKLMGNARDFMLDRIRNNWKPWQQMTVEEQQDLANAIEQQARDMIRGTVRALNNYEWSHCMVTVGQVTLKGAEKGIEAKITAPMVTENLEFLGQQVEKRVMLVATDAETFFGADRVKFDGRGSQMDLPLGGNAKDVEAGGFAAEEEALRAPVLDGPEPDPLAPEPGDDDEQPTSELSADDEEDMTDPEATPAPWPDDEQLGHRKDDGDEPGNP